MKMGRRAGWMAGLAVLGVAACGSTVENSPKGGPDTMGGSGGSVHAVETAGTGGTPGKVSPAGTAGTIGDDGTRCERDLATFCPASTTATSCPSSPAAVTESSCSYAESVTTTTSSCGGTNVTVRSGLGMIVWSYDASGKLIGASVTGDTGNPCFNGATTTYGQTCPDASPGREQCPEKCGKDDVCGAGGESGGAGAGPGGGGQTGGDGAGGAG